MKTVFKIICTLLFVPVFLVLLIAASLKFEILNDKFLINSFEKGNVYKTVQNEAVKYVESKNAKVVTDLITEDNVKNFTNKNVTKIISFMRGNEKDLNFYIPIDKVPAELLPKKLGKISMDMSAKELIQKFNINIDYKLIDQFRNTGRIVNYVFYFSLILALIVAVFSYPIVFIFFGFILIAQNKFVTVYNFHFNKILTTFLLPVLYQISISWIYVGIIMILLATIILFIPKFVKMSKHG